MRPKARCQHSAYSLLVNTALITSVLNALLGCSSKTEQPAPTVPPASSTVEDAPAGQATKQARMANAWQAYESKNLDEAWQLATQLLAEHPRDAEVLALAATVRGGQQQFLDAARLLDQVAEVDEQQQLPAWGQAADYYLQANEWGLAENRLRELHSRLPHEPIIRYRLAMLYNTQGRRQEAAEHWRALVPLNQLKPIELLNLIDLREPAAGGLIREIDTQPPYTFQELAQARLALAKKDPQLAKSFSSAGIKKHPNAGAVQAFHASVLIELQQWKEFDAWLTETHTDLTAYAEFWSAWGQRLAAQEQWPTATRALAEAIRLDGTNRKSYRHLGQCFAAQGHAAWAQATNERLGQLDRIHNLAAHLLESKSIEPYQEFIHRLLVVGREDEAKAWHALAEKQFGIKLELAADQDTQADTPLGWLDGFDVNKFPLPASDTGSHTDDLASVQRPTAGRFKLQDVAPESGLAVPYDSGFQLGDPEFYLYEVNGAGIAAFDYDADGTCDVYLVQSGGKPDAKDSTPNALMRQRRDEAFVDVAAQAGIADRGFGQGVGVGDLNQDGLPDLVVANIGTNTVYLNQGDGSFAELPWAKDTDANIWSTSVAIGDLDGDQLPEVVEIKYINDPDVYRIACRGRDIACNPQHFRAGTHRIYRFDANFAPERWTGAIEMDKLPNFGFGVVLGNLDKRDGNDLFIANDVDPNHYWLSKSIDKATNHADSRERFQLRESAVSRGCATGRNGESQACMGVAAGDYDRNGTLDFHVTNFYRESVNLFSQSPEGLFIDRALATGLDEHSRDVLGFGTCAEDFDNDGWLDLFVLNGHLYDHRDQQIPYQMLPQLFAGSPRKFRLIDPQELGTYWQSAALGRTAASCDWNRDGRMDLVASHLDRPFALLENRSVSGHYLQLELVGTLSERSAVGAWVVVSRGDESWSQWVLAGDGLMCSHENILAFGLGESDTPVRIEIHWPSGLTQVIGALEIDRRYLIIEAEPTPIQRM